VTAPGCIVCGMGSIKRSDALAGPVPSPFGWVLKIVKNYILEKIYKGVGNRTFAPNLMRLYGFSYCVRGLWDWLFFPPLPMMNYVITICFLLIL
jgi:hypothetical protein